MLKYGIGAFESYRESKATSDNPKYIESVERVAERLKKVIHMPNAAWEFVVFQNHSPNAFALPGGKVGINTGLFALIEDESPKRSEALLAAVLGHEISHATANHAENRMYRAIATGLVASALWYGLEQKGEDHPQYTVAAFGLASYLTDSLPLSRWQEYESDKIGAIYMAKAGYDPRESIELWRRLQNYHMQSPSKKPEFLRTHPPDMKRILALEDFMPIALKHYHPKN